MLLFNSQYYLNPKSKKRKLLAIANSQKKKNYYIWLSKKQKKEKRTTTHGHHGHHHSPLEHYPLPHHYYCYRFTHSATMDILVIYPSYSPQSFYYIVTYPFSYITSIVTHLSSSTILYSVSTLSQYNYFFSADSILI